MEKKVNRAVLSVGSNIGDRKQNQYLAFDNIESHIGNILKRSCFYENPSVGFESENNFINSCIAIKTRLNCREILDKIQWIEKSMGRIKTGSGYQDRIIDIDIIFFNNEVIKEEGLCVPHERYHERDFVLVPLKELGDLVDPRQDFSVSSTKSDKSHKDYTT